MGGCLFSQLFSESVCGVDVVKVQTSLWFTDPLNIKNTNLI